MRIRDLQQGVVLPIVLFFTLMLVASITTFLKRATMDAILARNRDAMMRSEALARGGVELAKALLIADRAAESTQGGLMRIDSDLDRWFQARNTAIEAPDGSELRLRIDDAGARLNLNAVFGFDENGAPSDRAEPFLQAFLERMIDEMPIDVQALYDPRELARNLIDWVDPDEARLDGGLEDDYYQSQYPPYRAANTPLLSIEDLALVEGFDATLLEVIRPYVTVYPYAGSEGVNPNTAPAHVLGLIFYNDGVEYRFAKPDDVERILNFRREGHILCPAEISEECIPIAEVFPNATSIHPPLAYFSDTFTVRALARVGDVRRTVEAVVDRSTLTDPLVLSWKVW